MSSGPLPGGWLSIASPQDPRCGTRGSSTDGRVIVVDKGDTLAQASLGAHPYINAARRYSALPSQHKSIEHPVSEGEIRASTYLAQMFGLRGVLRQLLVSDVQCETIPDSNFVALSGSNYKTEDILPSRENLFCPRVSDDVNTDPPDFYLTTVGRLIRPKIVTCLRSNDIVVSLTLFFAAIWQFRQYAYR